MLKTIVMKYKISKDDFIWLNGNTYQTGIMIIQPHSNPFTRLTLYHDGNKSGKFSTNNDQLANHTNYHIHVVSSNRDIIQPGDWCFNSYDMQIWQYRPVPCPPPYWGNKETLSKIICTTDPCLHLPVLSDNVVSVAVERLNRNINVSNVIIPVTVRVTCEGNSYRTEENEISENMTFCELCKLTAEPNTIPDSGNIVSISFYNHINHLSEEQLYTAKEVDVLVRSILLDTGGSIRAEMKGIGTEHTYISFDADDVDRWILDNIYNKK